MKISIIGLGWFGKPLAKSLKQDGHTVAGSTRSSDKVKALADENITSEVLNYPDRPSENLLNADIIVLNIPPFQEELEWFKSWKIPETTWMIFISSTSKAPLLIDQENWIKEKFPKWTVLRFAGLLGGGRHPGKSLSGRKNLPGRLWPVNLVHLNDVVEFTKIVIQKNILNKLINVVSDEHPTREQFYTDYCRSKNLPLPEFSTEDDSLKPVVSSEELKPYYSTLTSIKIL